MSLNYTIWKKQRAQLLLLFVTPARATATATQRSIRAYTFNLREWGAFSLISARTASARQYLKTRAGLLLLGYISSSVLGARAPRLCAAPGAFVAVNRRIYPCTTSLLSRLQLVLPAPPLHLATLLYILARARGVLRTHRSECIYLLGYIIVAPRQDTNAFYTTI